MNNKADDEILTEELNLYDYIKVIINRKYLIITITLSAAIITAIYSLMLPRLFMAQVSILPSQTNSRAAVLGELSSLIGIRGGSKGLNSPALITRFVYNSSITKKIVDQFGLMDAYKAETIQDAQDILSARIHVNRDRKTNIISIGVLDKDPQKAADMANEYADALNTFINDLALNEAAQRRQFFEEQLKKTKEELMRSEEAMIDFQERTGILKAEEQVKNTIQSIARLKTEIATKELEIRVMKSYTTQSNPELQKLQETLKGLKAQLRELVQEEVNASGKRETNMPAVGIEYFRKLRDLQYNEKILEALAEQYEVAKMDEAQNTLIIQVLEKALPPRRPFSPKRTQMVILATTTGLIFSLFLAFILEYISNKKLKN